MKFTPLGDRVLIRALDDAEQKVGGIIIPDTAKEKPQQGEVVAAGPGRRKKSGERVPLEVKAGDRILYGKYSGTEVNMDGQTYLILHEDEILARL
jgi:chaperonin GroES